MEVLVAAWPCLFLWLLALTVTASSSINSTALYSVLRNVDYDSMRVTINSSYSHVRGVIVHSHCSALCSSDDLCASFIHDGDSQTCWMFSDSQRCPLISKYKENSIIYAEKSAKIEDDCCSANDADHVTTSGAYRDCQDAFEAEDIRHRHVYHLSPDESTVVKAVCEFDSTGGWTVIQKRQDGSVDFFRNYANFTSGFGVLCREYWIGLENMYHLAQRNTKLSIYMEDFEGDYRTANYSSFSVGQDGVLHVSGYSGDAGDSLGYHDGIGFSAPDRIAYGADPVCPNRFSGGWWFGSCLHCNPNGLWRAGGKTRNEVDGIIWYTWKGTHYTLKKITMRLGV